MKHFPACTVNAGPINPDRATTASVSSSACRILLLACLCTLAAFGRAGSATEVLFVTDPYDDTVLRFDARIGTFLGVHTDVRRSPYPGLDIGSLTVGPDAAIYTGSTGVDAIARIEPASSQSLALFAGDAGGQLDNVSSPRPVFGPDGNLYVLSARQDKVLRYDGSTGAFLNEFITGAAQSLGDLRDMHFAPGGDLLVLVQTPDAGGPAKNDVILRFDGVSGAFVGEHISSGHFAAAEFEIGPDGNIYVSDFIDHNVDRFDGNTGVFIDAFAAPRSGGLLLPRELVFGPDGDLYVAMGENPDGGRVLRFDGSSGKYIEDLVPAGAGGLSNPIGLAFVDFDVLVVDNVPGNTVTVGRAGESLVQSLVLAGDIDVRIRDEATVVFDGEQHYTGDTIIGSGTFINNGSLAGNVRLNGSGRIGGSGIFNSIFASAGTVAPGNSIGVLPVAGDFVLADSTVLEIELDAGGRSDLVLVNGEVDLGGAMLNILADDGVYAPRSDYLIISNAGTDPVIDEFSGITINLPFLSPFVSTTGGDGNDVVLSLFRNTVRVEHLATNRNEHSVALTVDSEIGAGGHAPGTLARSFLLLSERDVVQALATTSGEIHPTAWTPVRVGNDELVNAVADRLSASPARVVRAAAFAPTVSLGAAGDPASEGSGPSSRVWGTGLGGYGHTDHDAHGSGAAFDYSGFVFGFDLQTESAVTAGVFLGHLAHTAEIRGRVDEVDIDTFTIGAYSSFRQANKYLAFLASYGVDDFNASRRAIVGNAVSNLRSDYDGSHLSALVEAGLFSTLAGITVRPHVSMRYLELRRDAFAEAGDPVVALSWDSDSFEDLTSTVGIGLMREMSIAGAKAAPELSIGWTHSWLRPYTKQSARFSGFGNAFEVRTPRLSRDTAQLAMAIPVRLGSAVRASVAYTGRYFGDGAAHSVGVGLELSW